jgi:hypothetical protein
MAGEQVGDGRPVTLDQDLREDALDVLNDALAWRLVPARWAIVARYVDRLANALQAGDPEAVRAAVAELELAGPVRAARVGDTPLVEAPEPVREEINELIHTLDGRDAAAEKWNQT